MGGLYRAQLRIPLSKKKKKIKTKFKKKPTKQKNYPKEFLRSLSLFCGNLLAIPQAKTLKSVLAVIF
jgi:hypothetical protein